MGAFSPSARSGLAGVCVALVLLVLPATASSAASNNTRQSLLGQGSGFERSEGSNDVRRLQRRLRAAGFEVGRVDGLFGPATEAAVRRFQRHSGLRVDGLVGALTRRELVAAAHEAPLRLAAGGGSDRRVVVLQRRLRAAGFSPGPPGGRFGPRTEAAVRASSAAAGWLPTEWPVRRRLDGWPGRVAAGRAVGAAGRGQTVAARGARAV